MRPFKIWRIFLQEDKSWTKEITIEDLPNEDLKIIAGVIGLEAVVKLMCELDGFYFSIPKYGALRYKRNYVLKHYDGTKKSRFELAKKFGFTEQYIYRIVRSRNIKSNKTSPL